MMDRADALEKTLNFILDAGLTNDPSVIILFDSDGEPWKKLPIAMMSPTPSNIFESASAIPAFGS
jgi:hypothetical protein